MEVQLRSLCSHRRVQPRKETAIAGAAAADRPMGRSDGATLVGFRKHVAGFLDRAKAVDIGGLVKIETEPEASEGLSTAIPEMTETRTRVE